MKLYSHPYSYTKEEFLENKKFSCHSWIPLSLEKINEIDIIVNQHQSFLNDKDLVGKFNALNSLLDWFLFHQSQRFYLYPKKNNPCIDFKIICHELLLNYTDVESRDYTNNTFLENIKNHIEFEKKYTWKQKFSFVQEDILFFLEDNNNDRKKHIINKISSLENYMNLFLKYSLTNKENKLKVIKI